jgi:multiple sugar transport system permease protein
MALLVPIVWLLSTSLKDNQQIFRWPPSLLPSPALWENFPNSMTYSGLPFGRFFLNTVFITTVSALGAVASCYIVAFSFSRLRWKGRNALFFVVVMTMIIPIEVIIVPRFMIYRSIHWLDSYLPLILPHWFSTPYCVFLLRQYMMTIPREMDEAATIDGCNHWQTLWRIIFPQSKTAAMAVIIFTVQGCWNDLLEPLIYLSSMDRYTATLGLSFFNGQYGTQWGMLMAAAILVVSPILLLFIVAQKYFIQGIVVSGVKG